MKKSIVFLLFAVALIKPIKAQLQFETRLEIDLKEDEYFGHKVYMFGEAGFVIRSIEGGFGKKNRQIKYDSYNNKVEFQKNIFLEINSKKSNLYDVFSTEKHIVEMTYDMTGTMNLQVLNGTTLDIAKFSMDAPKGIKNIRSHFAGDYVISVMKSKKSFSVMTINILTGSSHVQTIAIAEIKPSDMILESISSMDNSNEAIVCIDVLNKNKKESGKRTNTYMAVIDCENGRNKIIDINSKINNTLLSVNASKTEENVYILTGTYTTKLRSSDMAEGMFIVEIDDSKVSYVEYQPFSEFDEFLKYLSERTQQKLEKKKEKKERAGKEVTYSMRAVNHPIVITADAYFSLAEYYYPTYRTSTQTVNGQKTTVTEFDGYRYTHASLVKYGKDGKMQWDRTFELYPSYKPFYPIRFISTANKEKNELVTMVFCSRNRIVSKAIRYDGIVEYDKKSEDIETAYTGDKTKQSASDVDFWYDNYFMVHGTELIKNTSGDTKRRRRVYFISKLKF